MTVLSDTQIIQGLIEGQIICRPLRPENIRGASIDLTLGEWFWRCDADPTGVFNPYSKSEVDRYFAGPFQAKSYESVYRKLAHRDARSRWPKPGGWRDGDDPPYVKSYESPFENIPDDWPVIVLGPGERILAHSHEFVGIRPPRPPLKHAGRLIGSQIGDPDYRWLKGGTSRISARSSTGRVGLTVALCAGTGDPGFVDRWTWEMMNLNKEAIIIPVGERMAQISFYETGPTRESYGTEKLYESKYQVTDDVEKMVEEWVQENMLPRNYKDKRVVLGSLDRQVYDQSIVDLAAAIHAKRAVDLRQLHISGSRTVS